MSSGFEIVSCRRANLERRSSPEAMGCIKYLENNEDKIRSHQTHHKCAKCPQYNGRGTSLATPFPALLPLNLLTTATLRLIVPSDTKLLLDNYFSWFVRGFAPSKSPGERDFFKELRMKFVIFQKWLFQNNFSFVIILCQRVIVHSALRLLIAHCYQLMLQIRSQLADYNCIFATSGLIVETLGLFGKLGSAES